MSVMLAEIYDAFKDAGASEEKAREAATVLADVDKIVTTTKLYKALLLQGGMIIAAIAVLLVLTR